MLAALVFGFAAAFTPSTQLHAVQRAAVSPSAEIVMMATKRPGAKVAAKAAGSVFKQSASPTKPKVTAKAKPLSPGSNYPATRNIQKQKSGFGNFLAPFEKVTGKSKYGVPVFLPNGNVNPAYLAAERKAMSMQKKLNVKAEAAKTKKLKAAGIFELGDVIKKTVGNVGSGKEYYQSGR